MKKKVNYTREFKVQACELVLKDGVKVKTVEEKMKFIEENAIYVENLDV